MAAPWLRCPRCQVMLQRTEAGPQRCPACAADLPAATPATLSWYVVVNKQKVGPLPTSELEQMSHNGTLKPDDMVLQEGTRTWVPAAKVLNPFNVATLSPSQSPKQEQETFPGPLRTATFSPTGPTTGAEPGFVPPSLAPSPPSATPVSQVPGYEILGELGRGGMGVVYKARHTALKRLVALKMILAGGHASASELQRFRAEAEAVARLQHPNIVQIYEIGEQDGLPFFSLEFVAGGTLSKRLAGTPLPPRDAAQLTATLARAIEAAHQAGIIHRDLKPANVLLAGDAATPLALCVPKVADFGLAKTLGEDSGQTRTGAIMGTPSYMSPEQAAGQTKDICPRTDVYALGAMLYEMLTGRPPFRAATVMETLELVRSQEPVSPRTLQPGLPRDLETISLKCLHKDLGQRYGTARELADDLQRFLTNQPILAKPASLTERAVKFVKRNRLPVAAASAIFLLLFFWIITSTAQARRARKGEKEAIEQKEEAEKNLRRFLQEAAVRARQRGNLRDQLKVLDTLETALDASSEEWVGVRIERARAHSALAEPAEVRKVLDDLDAKGILGKYEGSALLLRGYTAMGGQTQAGFELIRKALDKPLPPAEKAFAEGLLAPTSLEAIHSFRAALKLDPYHEPSRAMLGLMLFMLGRIDGADEARDVVRDSLMLYPDNPNFKVLLAMIHARNGDKAKALAVVKDTEKQIHPRHYRVLGAMVDFMGAAGRLDEPDGGTSQEELMLMWARLGPDLGSIWPVGPGGVSSSPQEGAEMLMQMPPVLNRSLGLLVAAFKDLMRDLRNEKANTKLDQALRVHPEGTLYFIHAAMLFAQKKWAEARVQAHTAAQAPAIGRVRRLSLGLATACEAELALDKHRVIDAAMLKECLKNIRALLKLGPLRDYEAPRYLQVAQIAQDFDLTQKILSELEGQGAGDTPVVLRAKMRLESDRGGHVLALRTADRVLKIDAKDAEALRVRALAVEELRKALKSAGE